MPWNELGLNPTPPARKPNDFGKGRPINLQTNHFEVTIKNPNIQLVHYDVDIKLCGNVPTPTLPKAKRMILFETMRQTYTKVFQSKIIGFDSEKNAYSTTQLFQETKTKPGRSFEVELIGYGKPQKFILTMKLVNKENLSTLMAALKAGSNRVIPQTIMQMIEVLFQHNFCVRYERIGRDKMFSTERVFGNPYNIGGGKEALVGFFSSLRPVGWKDNTMLLNIDVVNAAFYKEQSVIDFIKELFEFRDEQFEKPVSPFFKQNIAKTLKKVKVQVTHASIPRTYKVLGLGDLGADRETFQVDNRTCTVQQYFREKYGKVLRYPRFNLLRVGPEAKKIYLPVECCKIAKGQKVQGKLNDKETAQFIKSTAKSPNERLQHINHIIQTQKFSADPNIRGLQFSVSDKPMSVKGHVLNPPHLLMKNTTFPPVKGVWDIRDKAFFVASELKCWAVLNYSPRTVRDEALSKFISSIIGMGKERGMIISPPASTINMRTPTPNKDLAGIKARYEAIQLIMVVLPRDGDYYARVKKTGDKEISVVTQCVKDINVNKNGPPLVGNLLLKINAKIGGINNVLGPHKPLVFNTPVMIMGADVNHPPAHDKTTPSLAAVIGSVDCHASHYATEVRHQRHRTEMIQNLKEMTKNLLIAFYRTTKRKPIRIIMYRDGVSESQFLEVLSFELKAMRDACKMLQSDYEPAMTFIVVQKRHHTRLFCNQKDGVGRAGNVPPGTTVDNIITHPTQRDFYLCSHQGIIGTSRPTHYHVLWDDSDLPMEVLQNLTYAMCHLYSRCTRSVSIPSPAYYAHLVAFRAKLHIRELCPSETSSIASDEEQVVLSDATMVQATRVGLDDAIATRLYFV